VSDARGLPSYFPVETAAAFGVVDCDGGLIAHAGSETRAWRFARLLRVLEPTTEQLGRLLDDPRLLKTLPIRHADVCWRCGRPLKVGTRVRWNVETQLSRHLHCCPRLPIRSARGRKTAA